MRSTLFVTILLAVGLGRATESQTPATTQAPQITATSPELERRDQPVTADDLAILVRAEALLSGAAVWNRADDRECKDDEATGKRSLFCALEKACIDVLGSYDHRRVALQEVRFAVEDATRGRDFEHRLRDFNNLPETRLEDIKRVLAVAKERVSARLKPAEAQPAEIATTLSFTEGPTVDRDGNVYFTEMVSLRIMKLSVKGVLSTFRERSNNANGLLIDPQGRLVACEGAESNRTGVAVTFKPQVTRTDMRTRAIEVLADNYQGKPFVGPNDVTIDGKGRLYFTDLTGGAVYRIDGPGRLARILAAPEIERPNGIQISPDDAKLYLIEANQAQGGARMIRSYDLQPDGTVRNMRVHYNFSPGRSADGMSIDTEGNLYASAGLNQLRGTSETLDTKAGVHVISPQGKLLKFIPITEDVITNNAFGGPDMKTLYVTAGKTLYKIRTEIAGLPR